MRLDKYLVENNFFSSRTLAQEAIKEGRVQVNGKIIKKASFEVLPNTKINIQKSKRDKYVSRAALKLLQAIDEFGISFRDKIVLDLGSSTGGFTQVALEKGASKVYAVDVGTNQMHKSLLNNPRLILHENTDARDIKNKGIVKEKVDFLLADLSFISIFKVLPTVTPLLQNNAEALILFKPQFELGQKFIGKNGIVKSGPETEKAIFEKIQEFKKFNFQIIASAKSKTKGKDGNQEYLIYFKLDKKDPENTEEK